jgi:hypothetical protein
MRLWCVCLFIMKSLNLSLTGSLQRFKTLYRWELEISRTHYCSIWLGSRYVLVAVPGFGSAVV